MKPFELLKVHHYEAAPSQDGLPSARLARTVPYVRLCRGSGPPLFLKDGSVYSEGGEVVTSPPAWFWEEVEKLSPATRESVRFRAPDDAPVAPVATAAPKPLWTCPECGKAMPLRARSFHVLKHKRDAVKNAEIAGSV